MAGWDFNFNQKKFWGPLCRQGAQSAGAQFAGAQFAAKGPNLPGPNLPKNGKLGPKSAGPNLPPSQQGAKFA